MSKVHIVTDSSAHFFDPDFPAKHQVTVVPLSIHFGATTFQDGVDIPRTGPRRADSDFDRPDP